MVVGFYCNQHFKTNCCAGRRIVPGWQVKVSASSLRHRRDMLFSGTVVL